MANPNFSGVIVGYDPGGNRSHGYAEIELNKGNVVAVRSATLDRAEDVLTEIERANKNILALGIDTLTCWGTGSGGWRPADRWLRRRCGGVGKSVMSPNGLYGSMSINGMAVLVFLRERFPSIYITETHPKVLYWALAKKRYDFAAQRCEMSKKLGDWLGAPVNADTEHEWDAALSAFAAMRGIDGTWPTDLHKLPTDPGERLIAPCGTTAFVWPVGH